MRGKFSLKTWERRGRDPRAFRAGGEKDYRGVSHKRRTAHPCWGEVVSKGKKPPIIRRGKEMRALLKHGKWQPRPFLQKNRSTSRTNATSEGKKD